MVKRLLMVGVIGVSLLMMSKGDVWAQYNYFGGLWSFNTYHHQMTYTGVRGVDFNNFDILFVSGTVWYDNALSCCVGKNCKNEPLSPGIGHFVLGEATNVALDQLCFKRGKCTGTVVYPNSVEDLQNDAELLADCRAIVGVPEASPQECFNLLFFGTTENQNCKNKNDVVVRVFTKGVCTTAQPLVCDDASLYPLSAAYCIAQGDPVGVRYTFPSFQQNPNETFAAQRDDSCIACVADPDSGACEPQL